MTTATESPRNNNGTSHLDAVTTLSELLTWRVAQTPQANAYLHYDEAGQRWRAVSWKTIAGQVERMAVALENLDLPRGSRIAILLPNGLQAVCVDQAALALALVPVPMHALDNPASIAYILSDSDTKVLVVFAQEQWRAIAATGVELPSLQHVIIVEAVTAAAATSGAPSVLRLNDWLAQAGTPRTAGAARRGPEPDDLAALVYTSGTTGKPKGVMLSHDNILENVKATLQRVAPGADDLFLSFLPLSHTFERTAGYYLPIAAGSCVAHARSVALLSEDLKTVRPTILISVPRIYERTYTVVKGMLAQSALKSRLFQWAQDTGWRRFSRAQQLPFESSVPALLDDAVWPLLDKLVAAPLRAQFGGRLRAAVSGGAALSQPIAHCFIGLGIPILQGYGMTETSPVVAANSPEDNDPATIGRPLSGVEVRIGENRELQVRGRSVMKGYWKREADTEATFIEGWLRTGDQAAIENGRIRILGRIKEIIVTSTGEKIAPSDLELAITGNPLFEQAYAFGDNRPFIACIVVLSRAGWNQLAQSLRLNPDAADSLHAPEARAAVLERIREQTHSFPYYAQPRAVALTLEPWTTENTLLTPTLKLKRKNMEAHFAEVIEHLYKK
ncbi:MAG: long-chain fatty acid--CoA ligase [bacterium]|nr:long-chain fatty acid--CoA ligase [bacterium]